MPGQRVVISLDGEIEADASQPGLEQVGLRRLKGSGPSFLPPVHEKAPTGEGRGLGAACGSLLAGAGQGLERAMKDSASWMDCAIAPSESSNMPFIWSI